MNTKLIIILAIFLTLDVSAGDSLNNFPTDIRYYTVQIKSFPYEERAQAYELFESLRDKNYPVYHQLREVNNKHFIAIRVGIFLEISQAKLYAKQFREKEGFEYFIDYANILVDNYNNLFFIITTPQSIYYWDGKISKEIYDKKVREKARISPNGKDVVFSSNHQIFKINIQTNTLTKLKGENNGSDSLISPIPSWSPDGNYIAYLMYNAWELGTSLWIMKKDGSDDRCLISYDESSQYCVKNYKWHPTENTLFYIFGFAFGTASVGGNIHMTDLSGNNHPVIEVKPKAREEIYRKFRIVGDTLYYKKAHFFDDQYMRREYRLYKFLLNNIK